MPDPRHAGGWEPPLPPPPPGTLPFDPALLNGPAFDEEPPPSPPDDDDWWTASGLPDEPPPSLPLTIKRSRRGWRPRLVIIPAVAAGGIWVATSIGKDTSSQQGPSSTSVATDERSVTPSAASKSPIIDPPAPTTAGVSTAAPVPATLAPTIPQPATSVPIPPAASRPTTPPSTSPPTTSPAPAVTTGTTGAAPTSLPPASQATTAPAADSSLTAGDRAVPDGVTVTLSRDSAVTATSSEGSTPVVLGDVERAFAFRDGAGIGVIYQRRSSQSRDSDGQPLNVDPDDTDIIRVRPDGSSLILYPSQGGRRLRLHDVRVVGQAPQILYSVESSDGVELLKLANPVAASTDDLGLIGAAPGGDRSTGVGLLHLAGDVIIGDDFTDNGVRLLARPINGGGAINLDALGLDALDPSNSGCDDACPRGFSVDADGSTLAWIEGSELVVARRDGAVPARRVALRIDPSDEVDIRLRSGVAIVNRPGLRPIIVDLRPATPTVTEPSTSGFAAPW